MPGTVEKSGCPARTGGATVSSSRLVPATLLGPLVAVAAGSRVICQSWIPPSATNNAGSENDGLPRPVGLVVPVRTVEAPLTVTELATGSQVGLPMLFQYVTVSRGVMALARVP